MYKHKERITKINVGKKGLTKEIIREINRRKPLYNLIKLKILKNCSMSLEEIKKILLNNNFKIKRYIGRVIEIKGEYDG